MTNICSRIFAHFWQLSLLSARPKDVCNTPSANLLLWRETTLQGVQRRHFLAECIGDLLSLCIFQALGFAIAARTGIKQKGLISESLKCFVFQAFDVQNGCPEFLLI